MLIMPDFEGPAVQAVKDLTRVMKDRARTELSLPESEIIVRSMRPQDLGFASGTYGQLAITAANTATNLVAANTIADNRYVGIYGIAANEAFSAAGTAELEHVRITRKGSVAREWNIRALQLFENQTGWFSDPVILDQNTTVTIALFGSSTSTVADFELYGVTVEKRGLVVNP